VGPSFTLLPVRQRLVQYRQLSEDALHRAHASTDREVRAGLLNLAAGWCFLAEEVEKNQDGADSTDQPNSASDGKA